MLQLVKDVIRRADLIVEVLDAREPRLTRSRSMESLVERLGKPLLLVLNKGDLVPRGVLESWKRCFELEGHPTVYIAATQHMGTKLLRTSIKEAMRGRGGIVGFVGYPKTGKSSIINALKGRHSATTSPHPFSPGYTKSLQLFRIDSKLYAIDSPGLIPPDGNPLERAIRGSRPEDLEDPVKVALALIERIEEFSRGSLGKVYKVDYTSPLDLLEKIARKRGWIYRSNGEPIVDQAAVQLIRDYHEGKITYYILPKGCGHD
ncbi:putative GTPase [Metallosphaera yellowstonensis MK1]|uniref:Putative GTPase n=1 Tax=Metallosphaera yellowstonensis MK1 TaxID=671065 RepID=H2C9E3_9CREN|nr:GTPase [Metallosphaera yellowstonensis]EHP68769.1 putative GTPase [Metallosphaera yellowstonensis MK1]